MVPQRIKMSGFLSYKDEQELCFNGSPLWMLSGTNGSGKSSVFDGVTFALFGHHRGGSQSPAELMNKESNTLSVEFDFACDNQLYRILRTVRRRNTSNAATQQVYTYAHSEIGGEKWKPVAGTHYKKDFDAWVKEKIGLNYETFTSSVLLLQGKSEKLLDSTPAGRAGVLAQIVDLERYQNLHGRADDRRRALKSELDGITNQLLGVKRVTDEEYAAVELAIVTTEDARTATQARIDALNALELRARHWSDLQGKLAAVRLKLADAEKLLGTALAIEKDYTRLRELRDVLPAVTNIVTERGRVNASERATEKLSKEREGVADARRKTENALSQARKNLTNLKKTLTEDEAKKAQLEVRLRELAGVLEKVKQVEDAEAEVSRLEAELKPFPADPEVAVRKFQSEHERLTLLEQHVALLQRLHQDRAELTKAAAQDKQARADEAKLKAEGVKAKEAFTQLEADAKAAREDRAG
ncbi:MAG: AAA family ATPase, partial [Gemmata sp.]